MKTEHELAYALKTLMAEMPLDNISVTSLTKKCNINRKTFYYHFHDIYDLLTLVFLDEKIPGILDTKNTSEMVKCIFSYYDKNKKFLDATIDSAGKDLFSEFIYNNCYQSIFRFVNNIPDSKKTHLNDRKNIARFYALGYANSIIYYLSISKTKTLAGMKSIFSFLSDDYLSAAVIKMRGKE